MVAANGSILNINAADEPDLAIALRGSGSQFGQSLTSTIFPRLTSSPGIVTQFTVQAHPMGRIWGGLRVYTEDKADEIFAAAHAFTAQNADDQDAAIILTQSFAAGGSATFTIFYYYAQPEPPTTGPFADFLAIEALIDSTSSRSYADLVRAVKCSRYQIELTMACAAKEQRRANNFAYCPYFLPSESKEQIF